MTIDKDKQDLRYDAACKQVLSERGILAYILKECVAEYADLEYQQIEQCIKEDPTLDGEIVEPNSLRVESAHTEDNSIGEGTLRYDIRFSAKAPKGDEEVDLIINVEAQNKYNPGYPIEKRAYYYGCRLISSQYGSVFTKSHYEKIRKVYTIWICTGAPNKIADTITKHETGKVDIVGTVDVPRENYDLMTVVIVRLKDEDTTETKVSRLLSLLDYTILNDDDDYEQKRQKLEAEFGIQMTPRLEEGVAEMCNLSQGLHERAEKRAEKRAEERIEKSIQANSIKIALGMLKKKMSLADIVEIVELPADKIREIAKDNGLAVS